MLRPLALSLPIAILVSSGCRTEYMEDAVPEYWLEIEVEATETVAGEPVDYVVTLHSTLEGELPVEYELVDAIEPNLYRTDARLFPTVAGVHIFEVSAEVEGELLTAQDELTVWPGPAALLDLKLSDVSTVVGESVDYTIGMWDFYGNELDTSEVRLETEDIDLEIAQGQLSSQVPGVYDLTASFEELSDPESLVVVVGGAASIELRLSDTELELFETSSATVVVRDAYGNITEDPWVLQVEGHDGADPTDVVISYDNLTFMDEGKFTVWALAYTAEGDVLEDSVGPLLVDTTGPLLEIDEPLRGDWNEGYVDTIAGTVSDRWAGVAGLQVDGVDVPWSAHGTFESELNHDFGLNLVDTTAWDADGNTSDDLRTVLSGSFLPYGSGLGNGLMARVNEGGLDEIEILGEGLVNDIDLDALIPSPVWSDYSETCVDLGWFGEYCFTWYSIYLYIYSPSISGTDLDLDSKAGYLDAAATIYDPTLYWSASGVVMEIGYSGSGDIYASTISVDMDLVPYVSSGTIHVDIYNVDADTSGFDFDWDSWVWDVIDFFGFDVDSLIAGLVESTIESTIADEVPAILEDTLGSLELATDLDFEGNSYAFDAVPYQLGCDEDGITLGLATYFTANSWNSSVTPPGSLYWGYSTPSWAASPGMYLGVSDDFLNQAMLALWGGGLLNMQLGGDDLGLAVEDIEIIFPEMTELNIVTEALLPPVVLPGSGTALLDMQLGDLELSMYGGPVAEENLMLRAYVTVFAGMDVDVDSDLTLSMELSDITVSFDVVHPEGNTLGASDTEDLLYALVPLILPMLTDALGEIPMPEIDGFALDNITIGTGGAGNGYLELGGDLNIQL
jgi:hypothetical protein